MAWVVDTCVLLDVLEGDSTFGESSAGCLEKYLPSGLVVCPVTFIELAPAFLGDETRELDFLHRLGAATNEEWTHDDTREGHCAWCRYVDQRRRHQQPKRPLADILIGAFAMRFDGIITRNPDDFRVVFHRLKIVIP